MPDDCQGHISGGNAISGIYRSVAPWIEATSCQAGRSFSALAHFTGNVGCNMLARKVERMMFIRRNRHLLAEVRALDTAVVQARALAANSAGESVAAQADRSNKEVDLSLKIFFLAD